MECHRSISQASRLAAILILSTLFLLLAPFSAAAQDSAPPQDSATTQDPPIRVARLAQIAGQVSVEPAGVDQWTEASANYPLTTGDRLYADQDGRVELQMEQTAVRVWRDTDLSITNLTDNITQLGVSQGSLHVRTFGLTPGNTVEIDTPNGAITVTQPGDFRLDCYTGGGGTVVTVDSGAVELSGPNLNESLGSGQSVRLMGTDSIQATELSMPGEDPFDAWNRQRDRHMLSSQTRQYVNPDTVGSDDLDQYGTWSQSPDYGEVWYPTGVPVDWVPYTTGRWVWVSPWGWTWVDTYPWGFAPFHYGRWAYFGSRWGWVPGPFGVVPVYSPALVGFVGGAEFSVGGVGLSAWFPLGPGEPYYPSYHHSERYFTQINVTNINRTVINKVTNITTINNNNYYNYYHNQNNVKNIRYVNRNAGTIAVHANEFASGRAITPKTVIRPTPQQVAHAQIIPHPPVAPTARSVVPRPVAAVPVSVVRPNLIAPRGELKPAPGGRGTLAPSRVSTPAPVAGNNQHPQQINRPQPINRNPALNNVKPEPSPVTPASHNNVPPPHNNIAPLSSQNLNSRNGEMNRQPMQAPNRQMNPQPQRQMVEPPSHPLIARTPPPQPRPTFEQRQPALSRDPGRALGPTQEHNLIQGRPAGPAHTPEFPPHPTYAPRPAYSPPRTQAPSSPRPETARPEAPRGGQPHH